MSPETSTPSATSNVAGSYTPITHAPQPVASAPAVAPPADPVSKTTTWVIAVLLVVLALTSAESLVSIWPDSLAAAANRVAANVTILWGYVPLTVTPDSRLMLIAIIMGILGSLIHAMTSIADYVGNRRLEGSWLLWYLLRPLIGMGLALFFYVTIRGGLFTGASSGAEINPFGVAALAGLAGMFSKQATDKLDEMFTALFRTNAPPDSKRADKLSPRQNTEDK
jgi:hypothetical protein